MPNSVKFTIILAISLWASAFVGIRAALVSYSPEGLALLRFLVASACMAIIYIRIPVKTIKSPRTMLTLFMTGSVGIGVYNIMLNQGELTVPSGIASFIASQTPIISAVVAVLFLNEKLTMARVLGFCVSITGVFVMSVFKDDGFAWDPNIIYLLLATLAGSLFTIAQKPFFKKYHPIEVTAFAIWGGTLFLLPHFTKLQADWQHASSAATATVVYLGIFPGAISYMAWSYTLSKIPVARAASFLYFMPFLVTLLGWLYLDEAVFWQSLVGGLLAIAGVILVNKSYQVATPKESLA